MVLNKVFVYGTLKRHEPNHERFKNGFSKFLYEAKTVEKYPLIISTKYNIPFLLYAPGQGFNVKGEVYGVDEEVFKNLDILEGHPEYYLRELHQVENLQSQECEKVWIYMIKSFKNDLLKTHQFLENYTNNNNLELKYCPKYLRILDEGFDFRKEIFPSSTSSAEN